MCDFRSVVCSTNTWNVFHLRFESHAALLFPRGKAWPTDTGSKEPTRGLSVMDGTDVERKSSPLFFSSLLFSCFRSHYCCTYLFCVLLPPEVTLALLDAANDKDADVQEQVRKSMLTLGKQQPDRVLSMCQDYLLKHPKVTFMNIFPILSITYFLHWVSGSVKRRADSLNKSINKGVFSS